MTKYFAGITNIEDLRKRYRELLKQFHPDNENGSTEITQQAMSKADFISILEADSRGVVILNIMKYVFWRKRGKLCV